MRRYASAFIDAVQEIGGIEKILYARVRDIIGPNSLFVSQSGTFPTQFEKYNLEATQERAVLSGSTITHALSHDCHVNPAPELVTQYQVLSGLGSHDLSAMREALGMPEGVVGASFDLPFWNVLFKYPSFTVSYEPGFYEVRFFDAHIEVYGSRKSVRIQYDSPYVKGLPVTMLVREDFDGALRETTVRKTYEDTFTLELKELYGMIVDNKTVKTDAKDALQDLQIIQMIIRASTGKPTVGRHFA